MTENILKAEARDSLSKSGISISETELDHLVLGDVGIKFNTTDPSEYAGNPLLMKAIRMSNAEMEVATTRHLFRRKEHALKIKEEAAIRDDSA